jgi:ferredoxin-nitrate reductase
LTDLGESICPYCGVGCRLRLEGTTEQITRVRGVDAAPANLGRMCAKGAQLGPTIRTHDRTTHPLIRDTRNAAWQPVSWDAALDRVADKFRQIIERHGPEAVAFYGSGQLDSETSYLVCKIFKGFLGCNNTDSNSRLCMAAAVAGYRSSLGSDAPPGCYDDIDHADVVLMIGSNMAEAHPVTFDRLRAAKRDRPQMQIVVVDPRRTQSAAIADLHLRVKPGGDIALLNAVGRILVDTGATDERFIERSARGFEEYLGFLVTQDMREMCEACGLERSQIARLARLIGGARGFLSYYCMGMNQSTVGMWKNNSLINLHLLTGQIGKPGTGPFSLTGQPNAMGGRECGLLCQQLPGYRLVEDPAHRAEVEAFWGLPTGHIQPQMGLSAIEMFRALEKGTLKAIWIAGTNPAVSLPDLHHVRRALGRAELVVVSDAYHPTETSLLADVVLPVAQWGEKDWTSTNSERMVSFSPKLWDAPGEALPDWEILQRFARKIGLRGFDYSGSSEIWDEFIQMTRGRPCDMAGATSSRLRENGLQWPCPSQYHYGTKRRYTDGVFPTPDGKAVFLPREHREPREGTDHEFPFILTTGRLYSHWHTLTRTGKAEKLVMREPNPFVEIGEDDAARMRIEEGEMIQISTRRGTIQLPARIKEGLLPGTVFVPFHWGDLYTAGNSANYLTISAIGRIAKQPELKFCAAALEKVPAAAGPLEQNAPRHSLSLISQVQSVEEESCI